MASLTDFRRVAGDVRNWGRWGDDDELGTLNFITADKVAQAASLVRHGKVFPLGVDFGSSGPQGAFEFRHNPMHVMTVDGGDANTLAQYGPEWARNPVAQELSAYFADNPFRFNDDMIIMPLQAATQWDALSHVYYEDKLYNGFPGRFGDQFRCLPLRHRQGRRQGHHLARCAAGPGSPPRRGGLPRTRKPNHTRRTRRRGPRAGGDDRARRHRADPNRLVDKVSADRQRHRGRLGSGLAMCVVAARPRGRRGRRRQPAGRRPGVRSRRAFLPMHMLCLRDMGLMFGEYWDLTALAADCAADGVYEFQLIAPPLRVVGAVGSPVNPIAIK